MSSPERLPVWDIPWYNPNIIKERVPVWDILWYNQNIIKESLPVWTELQLLTAYCSHQLPPAHLKSVKWWEIQRKQIVLASKVHNLLTMVWDSCSRCCCGCCCCCCCCYCTYSRLTSSYWFHHYKHHHKQVKRQAIHAWTRRLKSTISISWNTVLLCDSTRVRAFDEAEFCISVVSPEKSTTCWSTELCTSLLILHSLVADVKAGIGDIVFYEATCEKIVTMNGKKIKTGWKRSKSWGSLLVPIFPSICWLD